MTQPPPTGSVCEVAEIPIEMVIGPEYVTGSSRMKSGTGQKLICNMISTRAAAPHDGRVANKRLK